MLRLRRYAIFCCRLPVACFRFDYFAAIATALLITTLFDVSRHYFAFAISMAIAALCHYFQSAMSC